MAEKFVMNLLLGRAGPSGVPAFLTSLFCNANLVGTDRLLGTLLVSVEMQLILVI